VCEKEERVAYARLLLCSGCGRNGFRKKMKGANALGLLLPVLAAGRLRAVELEHAGAVCLFAV